MQRIDVSDVPSPHAARNKFARFLWGIVGLLLFRPSPKIMHGWRRFLLRLFGAKLGRKTYVYPSTKVWAPWNLSMGDYSCLASYVDCYCVAKVIIGNHVTVSQYSYLCTADHDVSDPKMRLIARDIHIKDQAWVCADVFVGPGVTIGEGAVVGARSSVFDDLPDWKICVGTPARAGKDRVLQETEG